MSQEIYSQILGLKHETNDVKRGRDFEALIREIQPWDHRPPIVSSQDSEQLDGVFIYKGLTYIIESKAVKKTITPGMHEWEDFALKINDRRDKRVVGLFCCLFDVSETVLTKARDLNMKGMQTIVIAGETWDELSASGIYFPSFIDYMMLLSNVKNKPSVDSIANAKAWIYDGATINNVFTNNAKKISAPFLRRFKHKYHDQLFVKRNIETQIRSFVLSVNPQSLKSNKNRDAFKQLLIVRDFSGSGKTTLSINLASHNQESYCFCTTANLTLIDEVLDNFLDLNKYPNSGISELLAVNKPFVFIIDSLDETPVSQHIHKRKEIKSLLKRVEELNSEASKHKLPLYPIILIFTIREEYWRDWETAFEGRQDVVQLKKVLSNFNQLEFNDALGKYSKAYDFAITNQLNSEAENILSVPINLEIFSEANHYEGEITVGDIWEGKILSNYFSKKEEALAKHQLSPFDSRNFYKLLNTLAYNLLRDKTTLFSKAQFRDLVLEVQKDSYLNSDQILMNLISEQIIITDADNVKNYRFKYIRFIEYLVALYIIHKVESTNDFTIVDNSIKVIYDSNIVSIYSVLTNIKHICKTQFHEVEKDLIDYYSHSDAFLSNYLPELRGRLARGEAIPEDAVKSIITNNFLQSPISSWNTFFIIAAKNVFSKKEIILSAFILAWETNRAAVFRWKLINRLSSRGVLLDERILYTMFKDSNPREWEEYFGSILEKRLNDPFLELWMQLDGNNIFHKLIAKNPLEWQYSNRLLDLIYRNEGFVRGDVYSDEIVKEYITFESSRSRKLPYLDPQSKHHCEDYIEEFTSVFYGNSKKNASAFYRVRDLTKEAHQYINIRLESILRTKHSTSGLSFFNFIINESPETDDIIKMVIENEDLDLILDELGVDSRTLFQDIIASNYENKVQLFQFIFNNGYKKTVYDDQFINQLIAGDNVLNAKEFENILIGSCFLKIKRKEDYGKLNEIYREVCVLLTMKYHRIIHFKFPNLLQVVNNALEHYRGYSNLFIHALQLYDRYSEVGEKQSFQKKVNTLSSEANEIPLEYKSVFIAIFPELF